MVLEERIRKKQQDLLNDYCEKCLDTCCDSRKHIIRISPVSLPLFQEEGIPVINSRELDKDSFTEWTKHPAIKLLLKNGSEVQKPAIIPVRDRFFHGHYLYANLCPFYSRENGCRVHEDSRRPRDCKQYPISIFPESNDSSGRFLDIRIMKSCSYKEELKSAITKEFPVRVID